MPTILPFDARALSCMRPDPAPSPIRVPYLALLHARPDRVSVRLVLLHEQLELAVVVLRLLIQTLIRLHARAASQHVRPRGRVQGAVRHVRTREPVKQIQK